MAQKVVATEVAEEEFLRWAQAMDLDRKLDPSKMDEEDKKSLAATKLVVVDAIEQGRLVVDAEGQFIFTPSSKSPDTSAITFFEPTGASLMAVDAKGDGRAVNKALTILADITKQTVPRFAKMANRDLVVCQSILTLFLAK